MKKILIAEYSESCYQLAERHLNRLLPEVKIVVAKDGEEARQVLRQNGDFDLLIINPRLPLLSGIELAKEYKQELKGKGFVVASTADIFFPQELKQHFDKVIFKPWINFDAEILSIFN